MPPAQLTDTSKTVTEKAKASIAAMMVNPASAEFYNLKRAVKKMLDEPVDTICGYVKGKNASGGDSEEMPFLYIIRDDRDGEAYFIDGRSYVAKTVHGVLCRNRRRSRSSTAPGLRAGETLRRDRRRDGPAQGKPITGIVGCLPPASAASGRATDAPPRRRVMNSRRFIR